MVEPGADNGERNTERQWQTIAIDGVDAEFRSKRFAVRVTNGWINLPEKVVWTR